MNQLNCLSRKQLGSYNNSIMISEVSELPKTDQECDDRLIAVVASYVIEKGMPFNVAINILNDNIRDQGCMLIHLNKLIQLVNYG